jgi:DNA/RNA endonuclease G (NUC1)
MFSSPPRRESPTYAHRLFIALAIVAILVLQQLPLIPSNVVEAFSSTVVISEFRTVGPSGGNDEFVELYNLTNAPIDISGWKINGSNNAGGGTTTPRLIINAGTTIPAHGHFLAVNTAASGYSGSVAGNQSYATGVTNDGGIALLNASNVIVDQVGMSSGSLYKEGTTLTSLTTNVNRCYERKPGAASGSTQDTDNNSTDFQLITPCDPQNLASTPTPSGTPTLSPGVLQLSAASYSVAENGNSISITVSRVNGSDGTVSVNYTTTNGTALSGLDYAPASGTLTFAAGETSKAFPVQILDDQDFEGNETVNLALTAPTGGAVLGSPSAALLTITDNEVAPTPTSPTVTGTANPNPVQLGGSTLLTAMVTPGTNPASSGITVKGNLSSIGGSSSEPFFDNGNNTFTFNASIPGNLQTGSKSLPLTVSDSLGRTGTATITLTVQSAPVLPGTVVISQVYGGGGNAGSTYKNDFIEIFNRSENPVDISGWSVQFASASVSTWSVRPLCPAGTCSLAPGQYFLIQESQGTGGTTNLPTADVLPNPASSAFLMSATSAKAALVNNTTPLAGANPTGLNIIDLLGYGTNASAFEGIGATPNLSNTTAALRSHGGCKDTDNNKTDFNIGAPDPRNSAVTPHLCLPGDFEPEIIDITPVKNAGSVAVDSNIKVTFDEPVGVNGNWYSISCSNSGAHTATSSDDTKTFTLNPDVNFAPSELCTVTVYSNSVYDLDMNDPQDFMRADYTWSFTTNNHAASEHMVMGNPSGATPDVTHPENYLMEKTQYVLSYHRDRGIPNWVSWHLDNTWTTGTGDRQNNYREDPAVPSDWYHVQDTSYQFSGFDRGHMCPSADRVSSDEDNSATFLMTNFIPQTHDNNAGPWEKLETYARTLVTAGKELYIISGSSGEGGTGLNGFKTTIDGGHVTVPAFTWKVILVLPSGTDDVSRVANTTRTIAVIMPNTIGISGDSWEKYLVSVDDVEALTGYDFFSNVSTPIQAVIESGMDGASNAAPVASNKTATLAEDDLANITLTATDANVNNKIAYTVLSQPANGVLSGSGANLVYTPNRNYFGPDSFTFKANDGQLDSNTATVTINVTAVNDAPIATNDDKSTKEDTSLSFPASELLANDTAGASNEDTQILMVNSVNASLDTHGAVNLLNGTVSYIPSGNYHGPASFTYSVCDNGLTNGSSDVQCSTGTVNLTVESVNDNPSATNDTATTDEDQAVAIDVAANDEDLDNDGLSPTAAGDGAHGTTALAGNQIVYTPEPNFNGIDSFTYTVGDGQGGTATATVQVTINAVNDSPVAGTDNAATSEDTPVAINVVGNDTDVDGDALTLESVGAAQHGTVLILNNQAVYSPAPNYYGPDSFTYSVKDGHGGSTTGAVNITITPVNDAPVLANVPASASINELSRYSFTATASDVDVPSQALVFSLVGAPAGASIDPSTGQFGWTPTVQQLGAIYTFKVRVTDSGNLFDEKQISIGVAYSWSGLLPPINADGSSVYKLGRTIPVKFSLTGASAGINTAVVRLTLAKISDGVTGTAIEVESTSAATTGNLFRSSGDGQYIFNLSTKGLMPGTYQLGVDMGDGVLRFVNISLVN